MTHICSECGSEIPEDSDFCYSCGAMKDTALECDDDGNIFAPSCYRCGAPIQPGTEFCPDCGAPLIKEVITPQKAKRVTLAFFLALVPGFFDIFGLGHIALKDYPHAVMFLLISGLLFYFKQYESYNGTILSLLLPLAVFAFQLYDVVKKSFRGD